MRKLRTTIAAVAAAVTITLPTTHGWASAAPDASGPQPHRVHSYREELDLERGGVQPRAAANGIRLSLPYSYWTFPGFSSSLSDTVTVKTYPQTNGHYFWSHQWYYDKGGDGGYAGIQVGSYPNNSKIAIFSIFGATAANGSNCKSFDNEGSGFSCRIDPFAWVADHPYKLDVAQTSTTANGTWYTAQITDTTSGKVSIMGHLRVPLSWGGMNGFTSWTEWFGDPFASCKAILRSTARWENPTAQKGAVGITDKAARYGPGDCGTGPKGSTNVTQDSTGDVQVIRPK